VKSARVNSGGGGARGAASSRGRGYTLPLRQKTPSSSSAGTSLKHSVRGVPRVREPEGLRLDAGEAGAFYPELLPEPSPSTSSPSAWRRSSRLARAECVCGESDGDVIPSSGCRDARSSAARRTNSERHSPRLAAACSQRLRAAGLARKRTSGLPFPIVRSLSRHLDGSLAGGRRRSQGRSPAARGADVYERSMCGMTRRGRVRCRG
jgi:hypothetical protein